MPTPLTIALVPGYNWVVGELVTEDKLNLAANPTISLYGTIGSTSIGDGSVTTAKLADGAVTAPKLASTLDLSGKTLTLPAATVTFANMDANFIGDATAKTTPIAADLLLIGDSADSNNSKKSTIAQMFAGRRFTDTAAIPAVAGEAVIPHGLGAIPFNYSVVLECTTTDAGTGVAAGQEVSSGFTASNLYPLFSIKATATNIILRRTDQTGLLMPHQGNGVRQNVTSEANFRLKVRADL